MQLPCSDDFITPKCLVQLHEGCPSVCSGPGTGWGDVSGLSDSVGPHGQMEQRELGCHRCAY